MMSPQDVLQGQRTIAPRTHTLSPRIDGGRSSRDERRRATHNEGTVCWEIVATILANLASWKNCQIKNALTIKIYMI